MVAYEYSTADSKNMKKSPPKKTTSRKSKTDLTDQTDWERLDAMTDDEIDFSDIPEVTPEMFAHAVLLRNHKVVPRKKEFRQRSLLVVRKARPWI